MLTGQDGPAVATAAGTGFLSSTQVALLIQELRQLRVVSSDSRSKPSAP